MAIWYTLKVQGQPQTFTNPLLPSSADPWVIYHSGFYYYTNSMGSKLELWKTANMGQLGAAPHQTIWTPPKGTAYSKELWAPELHFLAGKWYIYFAADDGNNKNHRIYVLENDDADPMTGKWILKGKIGDATDKWTDHYALGMLTANSSADFLDTASWTKSHSPVFKGSEVNSVFAPGHNAFFKSPDGRDDWIIYHANPQPGCGCDGQRSPRMQKFSWNSNGTPHFGDL